MLLTFSNITSASFFGNLFKELFGELDDSRFSEKRGEVNNVRCKVEYTQLDLATGIEKNVKHTDQYVIIDISEGDDILYSAAQDITDKINIWLNKSKNNVITNLTIINCKERYLYMNQTDILSSEQRWGEYKGCADEFNIKLIDFLDRPKQWGYNVNKARLIKDYEDGCKNYNSRWR
jgi:hypothetical protein